MPARGRCSSTDPVRGIGTPRMVRAPTLSCLRPGQPRWMGGEGRQAAIVYGALGHWHHTWHPLRAKEEVTKLGVYCTGACAKQHPSSTHTSPYYDPRVSPPPDGRGLAFMQDGWVSESSSEPQYHCIPSLFSWLQRFSLTPLLPSQGTQWKGREERARFVISKFRLFSAPNICWAKKLLHLGPGPVKTSKAQEGNICIRFKIKTGYIKT